MTIKLNRDLTGQDVPQYSYLRVAASIQPKGWGDGPDFPYAIARLRWFADSFDPDVFKSETRQALDIEGDFRSFSAEVDQGGELEADLSNLRGALSYLALETGGFAIFSSKRALVVDKILDAAFKDVTGGGARNAIEPGPYEPALGEWTHDDGPHERIWINLPAPTDRELLLDRVETILKSPQNVALHVRDVFMYPPSYGRDPEDDVTHGFMIFYERSANHSAVPSSGLRAALRELGEWQPS